MPAIHSKNKPPWFVLTEDTLLKRIMGTTGGLEFERNVDKIAKKEIPTYIWSRDARGSIFLLRGGAGRGATFYSVEKMVKKNLSTCR